MRGAQLTQARGCCSYTAKIAVGPPAAGVRWRRPRHSWSSGLLCRAGATEEPEDSGRDVEAARQQFARLITPETTSITGEELRNLVVDNYDVRLQKRGEKLFVHVMWRYLEQKSFPLTEDQYQEQLDAVAEYVSMWGVAETVRAGIKSAKHHPGYIVGGGAKAYQINLGVDLNGGRNDEWNSF